MFPLQVLNLYVFGRIILERGILIVWSCHFHFYSNVAPLRIQFCLKCSNILSWSRYPYTYPKEYFSIVISSLVMCILLFKSLVPKSEKCLLSKLTNPKLSFEKLKFSRLWLLWFRNLAHDKCYSSPKCMCVYIYINIY